MFVTESVLPDASVTDDALDRWRAVVPTARRVVIAHWRRFIDDLQRVQAAATGQFDAYLMMPRGPRDEEFHAAITELLSDWGATVAAPEAEVVRIAGEGSEPLTGQLRDFLDRMGMPYGVHDPQDEAGARILAKYREQSGGQDVTTYPVIYSELADVALAPSSVADVAMRIYGRPDDIGVDAVADLAIVGAGPAGLGADVVVVGGGNPAGQAAVHLAKFARTVTIVMRRPALPLTMSQYLVRELAHNPRVTVTPSSQIVAGGGAGRLEWIEVRSLTTGEMPTTRSAACSSCWAPSPTPSGCPTRWQGTRAALC